MSIGIDVFNNTVSRSDFVFNKFITIYTFDNQSTPTGNDIETLLANGSLFFSPAGSLFNGETKSILFKNPLSEKINETFQTNSWNGEQLSLSTYDDYNTSTMGNPSYFVSIGEAYGSGWLLYRELASTGDYMFKLLYNPMNRNNQINDLNTYGQYCSAIGFRDPGCYCNNFPNQPKKCTYAFLGSEGSGQSILGTLETSTTAENAMSLSALNNNCGCNSTCKNWSGHSTINQPPSCGSIQNLTFCGISLSSRDKANLNLAGIQKITQNCSTNSNDASNNATFTQTNYTWLIVGGIVLIICAMIILKYV